MMSFIKKDFLMIKANIKTFLLIIAFYIIMFFASEGEFDMTFFLPFVAVMLLFSTFSYDEFNNWNAYSITLPGGRKNAINGKYVGGILLILVSTILGFMISIGLAVYNDIFNLEETLFSLLAVLSSMIIVISITYPLIYKLGLEKGRIAMMIIIFGGVGILSVLGKIIGIDNLNSILSFVIDWDYIVFPVLTIVSLVISYFISIKIYLKKEF